MVKLVRVCGAVVCLELGCCIVPLLVGPLYSAMGHAYPPGLNASLYAVCSVT